MTKFLMWCNENSLQISWFIIGWMTVEGFNALGRADYYNVAISWGLAVLNYVFARR